MLVLLFVYNCQSIHSTLLESTYNDSTCFFVPLLHILPSPCSPCFHRVFCTKENNIINYKNSKVFNTVGAHNIDIISIIFGSLLGKGYADRKNKGTRIFFYQEGIHVKYLLLLHNQLATMGYCKDTVPELNKKLGKKGKLYKITGKQMI